MGDIRVTFNDAESRYEIHSGEALAGFAGITREAGRIRFTHTVVDPAYRGQGIAGRLADFALNDAAAGGETIVPECPYIQKYLREHEVAGAKISWPDEGTG